MTTRAYYGITALRYSGGAITEAMMGLVDGAPGHWELQPAPTRLIEVVNRLLEGDTVVPLFRDGKGGFIPGPQVKVDVLPGGAETLAQEGEAPAGAGLADLPRF